MLGALKLHSLESSPPINKKVVYGPEGGPYSNTLDSVITPRAHARARGYVIGRGVYILYIIIVWTFFWNQSFVSKNTHFERSILTQIGFSSNLMASGTA